MRTINLNTLLRGKCSLFFYKNYVKLHQKKRFVDFANEIYWRTECAGAVTQIKIDDYKIYA